MDVVPQRPRRDRALLRRVDGMVAVRMEELRRIQVRASVGEKGVQHLPAPPHASCQHPTTRARTPHTVVKRRTPSRPRPCRPCRGGTLASLRETWQGRSAMPAHRPSSAGGALLALGAVGGAAIGFVLRQPTAWFLAGLAAGTLAALLVWLRGR
jgi:hypothetical protein